MADKLTLTQNRKARERAAIYGRESRLRYCGPPGGSAECVAQPSRFEMTAELAYLAGYRSRRAEERRERKS